MIELAIFASTFLSVFALGLQSLNVNQGHYLAAGLTSFAISTGHIALYRFMPEATLGRLAAYYAGGITGITSSMWFHRRFKLWWAAWRLQREARRNARRGQGPPKAPPRPLSRHDWPPPPRLWDDTSALRGAMRCVSFQCPYEASSSSNYCGSHRLYAGDTH